MNWLQHTWDTYVLHVQWRAGYQFWSGFGSDLGEVTLVALVIGVIQHHNCHSKGCKSIRTHKHPKHGWPACKRHWNEVPSHVDPLA